MDDTSYGWFECAKTLVKLVQDKPKVRAKIAKFLCDYVGGLYEIVRVRDSKVKGRLLLLWRNEYIVNANFDPESDSYLKNVIDSYYKIYAKAV
jgi:hypothetical protein